MQKKCCGLFSVSNLKNLKVLITIALFSAISFVFGKFLAIPVGDYLRFSFENLPIILSGVLFGPICGCVTGIIADIVGCILRGYVINPMLTLGAALIGFLSGVIFWVLKNKKLGFKVSVTVFIAHLIGSVVVKSIGLSLWYSMDLFFTLGMRSINYIIVGVTEGLIIVFILRNKGFVNQINRLTGEKYEL
ncbi:MAG: folate family ECF transporter S component [Acutalibacteraceae bacterium]|nr:folate family ECF transporter S component [Acutalibacteraceae bacterium]